MIVRRNHAPPPDNEKEEIAALLQGIHRRYGYDLSHYARASLIRRIRRAREEVGAPSYEALLQSLCDDEKNFDLFLRTISVTVTDMFRNPLFYRAVRETIIPILRTYPFMKIWHAGCATGEEAFSMAMFLHEEGMLHRARIYATDFNPYALQCAQEGVSPTKQVLARAIAYREAGGSGDFLSYYSFAYDFAKIADFLKQPITFSHHNLISDGIFGEMNLILCRNVLIYFDRFLQNHVISKFADSLRHGGYLCLGDKETIDFTAASSRFETLDAQNRIYRKNSMASEPFLSRGLI